jgi:hypothetical protein
MNSREWKKHKAMCKARFRAINRSWPREQRPSFMQTWLDCGDYTVLEMLAMKTQVGEEDQKRNLGQDIFMRDSKPKKKKFKAETDNGKTKLHGARFLRPPLCPPKDYYTTGSHAKGMKLSEISRWTITAYKIRFPTPP